MINVCSSRLAFLSACFILTGADSPLVIQPPTLVVEYGTPASASCSTNSTHMGMGWEASLGQVPMIPGVQHLVWRVETLTHFDIKPWCYINTENGQEELELQVTVYKIPDIFIKIANHQGPLDEGTIYLLQCDIIDVAPIQNLTVTWYKNDYPEVWYSFKNNTLGPVSVSHNLQIQPTNNDDGASYFCEAKLELGPKGPPPKKSKPLKIKVNCHTRTMFWGILGSGLALAAVLVVGYIVKEMKTPRSPNKSKESCPGAQTEELQELKN